MADLTKVAILAEAWEREAARWANHHTQRQRAVSAVNRDHAAALRLALSEDAAPGDQVCSACRKPISEHKIGGRCAPAPRGEQPAPAGESAADELRRRRGDDLTCLLYDEAVEWAAKQLDRDGQGRAAEFIRRRQAEMRDLNGRVASPAPLAPEARSLKKRISKEEFRRGVNAAAEKIDAIDSADHARAQAEAESPPSSRSAERPATGRCPVCQAPAPCPNGCDWGGRGEGVLP